MHSEYKVTKASSNDLNSKQVSWRTRALVVSDWTRRFIFGRDSSQIWKSFNILQKFCSGNIAEVVNFHLIFIYESFFFPINFWIRRTNSQWECLRWDLSFQFMCEFFTLSFHASGVRIAAFVNLWVCRFISKMLAFHR